MDAKAQKLVQLPDRWMAKAMQAPTMAPFARRRGRPGGGGHVGVTMIRESPGQYARVNHRDPFPCRFFFRDPLSEF